MATTARGAMRLLLASRAVAGVPAWAPFVAGRGASGIAWPAEVPAGGKPFDPKGPLSQIDGLIEGLPQEDPWVIIMKKLKDLRLAHDKLEAEWKAVRRPPAPVSDPPAPLAVGPAPAVVVAPARSLHLMGRTRVGRSKGRACLPAW